MKRPTKIYYYRFSDGYEMWSCGRMSKNDIAWEQTRHGKLLIMEECK